MSAIVKVDAVDIAGELPQIFRLAGALKQAGGFLPAHIRNEGELVAIILAGRELGLSPMTSLRSINLIKGRVTLSADAQLALMVRAGAKFHWASDGGNDCAELHITRPGQETHVQRFTMEDAKRAQLAGGENWRKYPQAMLRARCVSAAAKAYFPDVLAGVYVPEELEEAEKPAPVRRVAPKAEFAVEVSEVHAAAHAAIDDAEPVADLPADPDAVDEYGLAWPALPCPVVSKQAKEYAGKLWTDVPEWMVEKWLQERGDKMNAAQKAWAKYISDRRKARKAREAAAAEAQDTSSEGGGWVGGDETAAEVV